MTRMFSAECKDMEKAEEQVVIRETGQRETTGFRIFVLEVGRYME